MVLDSLAREPKLAAERRRKFWGTANVDLDILDFAGDEDEENVARLAKLLEKDFRGFNPLNHIPAKVNQEELEDALVRSGVTVDRFHLGAEPEQGFPNLQFAPGFRLKCLHGRDRAAAALRIFPPGRRLWSIDLFHSGTATLHGRAKRGFDNNDRYRSTPGD
jgi:hypothetical protein